MVNRFFLLAARREWIYFLFLENFSYYFLPHFLFFKSTNPLNKEKQKDSRPNVHFLFLPNAGQDTNIAQMMSDSPFEYLLNSRPFWEEIYW